MNNLTNCTVEGIVVGDPESRKTKTGRIVTTFQIAINHYSKPGEPPRVSFISVEDWNNITPVKKGYRITVCGNLRQDRWADEKNNVQSRLKVIANEIIIK